MAKLSKTNRVIREDGTVDFVKGTGVSEYQDMNGMRITSVADGVAVTDAANIRQLGLMQNLASAPTPVIGRIYWDTTLEELRVYTGAVLGWKTITLT